MTGALLFLLHFSTACSTTFYVAPNGKDTNTGTSSSPFATITQAQSAASSGDTVYLRGGTYFLNNSHITATNKPWVIVNNISKDGISYLSYPGERPVFDFSNVRPVGHRVTAFLVKGNNCVFKGFEVTGVQVTIQSVHTQSECFRINGGSFNLFENLSMHDGMGNGWYLTSGSSNLVLNCDAYNNRGLDNGSIGNIDGFGCHPQNTTGTGNVIRGCRAWFNSDDGYDLINADASVTIENCWAFYNGYSTNFVNLGGDGHGFKAGGYGRNGSAIPKPVPHHTVKFCLAVGNRTSGFYANHHPGRLVWFNNTSYRNSVNYNMLCTLIDNLTDVPSYDQLMKNNLGYRGKSEVRNLGAASENDVAGNYFTLPVTVARDDFLSMDESLLTQPRKANGDLPDIALLRLRGGSDLIDQGVDIGFPFEGLRPDLGAFEFGLASSPRFDSIKALIDGVYRLTFSGLNGLKYEIRSAPKPTLTFGTQWDVLGMGTISDSPVIYDDLRATGHPTRFYHLRVP